MTCRPSYMIGSGSIVAGQYQSISIQDLYLNVDSGAFALPEFQRTKVWGWKQERELLISLAQNVPIGSFLLWEYDSKHKNHRLSLPHKFDYSDFVPVKYPFPQVKYLILDGQQRLGFLASIRKTIGTTLSDKRIVANFYNMGRRIMVDFEKFDASKHLDMSTLKLKNPNTSAWVDELVDIGNKAVIPSLNPSYKDIANDFRNNINGGKVGVYTLPKTEERYKALFVYQRVNSSGKPLVDVDYAEATLGYVYPKLSTRIKDFIETMEKPTSLINGLEKKLSRKCFIKCMLDEIFNSVNIGDARKKGLDIFHPRIIKLPEKKNSQGTITQKESNDPLTKKIVKDAFEDVKTSFEELRKMFHSEWHLDDGKYLLTNELLFASAYIRTIKSVKSKSGKSTTFSSKKRGELSRWMFLSMVKKPTTGGSTQMMARDACRAMRKTNPWAELPIALTKNGIPLSNQLIDNDMGVIDDVKESKISSSSTYFALLKYHIVKNGCLDIVDSTNLNHKSTHIDHFYAQSKMKKYFSHLWDHAANKIYLNPSTNMWKQAKWPNKISHGHIMGSGKRTDPDIVKNLTNQAVPDNSKPKQKRYLFDDSPTSHVVSKYLKFLSFRRIELIKLLNNTLHDMETNGI